jgi:phosphomevalonate kinase
VTVTRTFAPGKIFVIGEYAVLSGGHALVAALDAGIRCDARESRNGWRLTAPDLGVDLSLGGGKIDRGARLLAAAVTAAIERFSPRRALDIHVAGTHPALRRKSGLGGSAAATVAVIAAIAATEGVSPSNPAARDEIFSLARSVHSGWQHGRGSGADVAASVYGGWLQYALGEDGPRILPRRMPAELRFGIVWTGVAADTASALVSRERGLDDARHESLAGPLDRFWRAFDRAENAVMLASLSAYGDRLAGLAPNEERRLAPLVGAAREAGAAAKGSGAVGGDCVIALALDPKVIEETERRWRALGADVLRVGTDVEGVREVAIHA